MFNQFDAFHLKYNIVEQRHKTPLIEDFQLHVLQLHKWQKSNRLHHKDFWLYFLTQAKRWNNIPSQMYHVNWLEQAISVLQGFSESKREKLLYISRVEARRQQITEQELFEQEHQMRLTAEAQAEQEKLEKQAALEEIERLKAQLNRQS